MDNVPIIHDWSLREGIDQYGSDRVAPIVLHLASVNPVHDEHSIVRSHPQALVQVLREALTQTGAEASADLD
jgi:hypothetical protein